MNVPALLSTVPAATRAGRRWSDTPDRLAGIAILLRKALMHGSGGTVDPRTCRYANLHQGYMVSLRRFGRRFAAMPSVRETIEWLQEITVEWVDDDTERYIGVWWDPSTGDCWCDVSVVIDEPSEAMRRGMEEGQRGIYDNARRQSRALPLTDATLILTTIGDAAS